MNLVTCPICERHYIADVPAEIELHAQLHYRLGRSSWPPALTEHIKALGWALAYNDGGLTRRQWSQEAGRLMVVYAWWEDEVFRGTAPEEFETFIAMRLKFVAAKVAHDLPAIERAEAEYRAWQARQLAAHQPTPRDACWSAALQAGYLYVPARTYRGQELIREWHAWCAQHRRPAVSVQVRGACAEVRLIWEGSDRKLAVAGVAAVQAAFQAAGAAGRASSAWRATPTDCYARRVPLPNGRYLAAQLLAIAATSDVTAA